MAFHLWSAARYGISLPPDHRFPMAKYRVLREWVLADRSAPVGRVHDAERAGADDLTRVHSGDYVERVTEGRLGEDEVRRLGFPWSPHLVERAYRSVGGTLAAARAALEHGVAVHLAGGTHHAFPDRGEGFCVFNDVAVAVRVLQHEGQIHRAAVIDLDVHQGHGTHAIFADDLSVVTFSMHGRRNYPFTKVPGSFDIELEDGTGDDGYLPRLGEALPRVLAAASADLVVYLAGADPHEGDRLGRLKLSFDGLVRRDVMVLQACREVGIPVAITMAGGYGRDLEDTVRAHANTVRVARTFAG